MTTKTTKTTKTTTKTNAATKTHAAKTNGKPAAKTANGPTTDDILAAWRQLPTASLLKSGKKPAKASATPPTFGTVPTLAKTDGQPAKAPRVSALRAINAAAAAGAIDASQANAAKAGKPAKAKDAKPAKVATKAKPAPVAATTTGKPPCAKCGRQNTNGRNCESPNACAKRAAAASVSA